VKSHIISAMINGPSDTTALDEGPSQNWGSDPRWLTQTGRRKSLRDWEAGADRQAPGISQQLINIGTTCKAMPGPSGS